MPAPKFYSVARKRTAFIETPPAIVADIMKLFTSIDTDSDGRIASHDMGKHLYAINRLYKLLHGISAAARGFSDTTEIIAHFDEDDDGDGDRSSSSVVTKPKSHKPNPKTRHHQVV